MDVPAGSDGELVCREVGGKMVRVEEGGVGELEELIKRQGEGQDRYGYLNALIGCVNFIRHFTSSIKQQFCDKILVGYTVVCDLSSLEKAAVSLKNDGVIWTPTVIAVISVLAAVGLTAVIV